MMSSGRWRGVGPAGACSSSRQLRLRLTQRRGVAKHSPVQHTTLHYITYSRIHLTTSLTVAHAINYSICGKHTNNILGDAKHDLRFRFRQSFEVLYCIKCVVKQAYFSRND